MNTATATKEQAESIAKEVWGYKDPEKWDAHGTNTTSLWQETEGKWTGHWYINRTSAYDVARVRMGRTLSHLLNHKQKIEENRNRIGR